MSDYRIYVACLASYNNGILHGAWIDLDSSMDAADIQEAINKMLELSEADGAEEFAIHDFELDGVKIDEFEDLENVCKLVKGLEDHGEAFAEWCKYQQLDYMDDFEESYAGTFKTKEDWAEEHWEQCGFLQQIPESLRYYIDYESYVRDAAIEGMMFLQGSEGWHVFQW